MAKKIYDLVVANGKYQSNGQEKTNYVNIGVMMEKDDGGKFILLERTFNPAGVVNLDNKSSIIVSMYPPKNKDAADQVKEKFNGSDHETGSFAAPDFNDSNVPF